MQVIFCRGTGVVKGIDRELMPFESTIYLPVAVTLSKTIEVPTGRQMQKIDEQQGQPLFWDGENETTENSGDLEPVTIDEMTPRTFTLKENPYIFSEDEVVATKGKTLAYYDEDFEQGDFSIDLASYAADMGAGFIAVHPGRQCRTKKISLGAAVTEIEVYSEKQDGLEIEIGPNAADFYPEEDGVVTLPEPAAEVYVRFKNNQATGRELYALGLLI